MDFSENVSLKYQDAVQSSYFGQRQISLYTVTMWNQNKTTSQILVSDVRDHDKITVIANTMTILDIVTDIYPHVKKVNFFSDGPSSQYKNKYIFAPTYLLQQKYERNIDDIYWHYFATSHGKGPCDSLGGNAKRIVTRKLFADKDLVVDNAEFFCKVILSSGTTIRCEEITADQIKQKLDEIEVEKLLEGMKSKVIRGTKNTHYLKPSHSSGIITLKCYTSSETEKQVTLPTISNEPAEDIQIPDDHPIQPNAPATVTVYLYIYIYIYVCLFVCLSMSLPIHLYIYFYIYYNT